MKYSSHPSPDDPVDHPPADNILHIDTNPTSEVDVRLAIKAMKNGKAADIDAIHAEMLKADLHTSTKVLTGLFRKIWEKDVIPD